MSEGKDEYTLRNIPQSSIQYKYHCIFAVTTVQSELPHNKAKGAVTPLWYLFRSKQRGGKTLHKTPLSRQAHSTGD